MINIFTRFPLPARFVFCLLFFQLFISAKVFSQGKFLDGYVISSKGDTLKGFIRYKDWDESPAKIDFTSELNGKVQSFDAREIKEFYISTINLRYKSRKIGIPDIDLDATYNTPPSLIAKDSLTIFLQEVVSSSQASLLEYINDNKVFHYYLEKDEKFTELINYSFYRLIRNNRRLLTYDDYTKQLPELLADSPNFKLEVPDYSQKDLQKYVQKYNESLGEKKYQSGSTVSNFTFDINFNGGLESWKENNLTIKNKITYGFGMRLNLPRNFHNRYVKLNLSLIPGIFTYLIDGTNNIYDIKKITVKTIELGLGSYIGSGKIKPFAGIDVSLPLKSWRTSILGPNVGIGFLQKFNLEISHFVNFYSAFVNTPLINKPRITLNYYLNLNNLFKKK